MARSRRNDRAEIPEFRLAIYRLQDSAYANLRSAIANVCIFFGAVGIYAIFGGMADGARLWPNLANVTGGLLGVGYYLSRSRPGLALRLLVAAGVSTLVGMSALALVVYVVQR